MNNNSSVLSLISLCMKAGKIQTGETAAEIALRNGTAQLVIIAGDASDNTKRKFINKCFYYKKPARVYSDRETLSKQIGRQNRTVFVITEPHFAEKLSELIAPMEAAEKNMEVAECPKPAYMS